MRGIGSNDEINKSLVKKIWLKNPYQTFGKSATSSVVGMSGTAGAVSAVVLNPLIGLIVTKFSYESVWWCAGLLYMVSFLAFMIFIPKLKLLKAYA